METAEYKKMYQLENHHFWFLAKKQFILTFLEPHKNMIRNILDIGCGTGGTSKFLEAYGILIGLDRNKLALEMAKKRGVKTVWGEAENLPFSDNSFDLVTMLDVLYHKEVKDEKKAIKEAKRVLKPGGFLLITDCAFKFLQNEHDGIFHGKRRFSLIYLSKIINELNMKILRSSYIYFSIFPLIVIKRKIINSLLKEQNSDVFSLPPLINTILLSLLWWEARLLKYLSLPFGSSLIIMAQKIN